MGMFRTDYEAALCYARYLGPTASAFEAAYIKTVHGIRKRRVAMCDVAGEDKELVAMEEDEEDEEDENDDEEDDGEEEEEDEEEEEATVATARSALSHAPKRQRTEATDQLVKSAQHSRLSRVSRGQKQSDGSGPLVRPSVSARVRVRWPDDIWYDGTVIDADVELGRGAELRYRFRVAYDDGTVTWHVEGEESCEVLQ